MQIIKVYTESEILNKSLINAFTKKPNKNLYVPYEQVKELVEQNEKLIDQLTLINARGFLPEAHAGEPINNISE